MEREIRVGLCGCGVIGEGLVTALLEHADVIRARAGAPVRLVAVADKDPARLDIVRAQDPSVALLDDAFELVTRDDVDVVVELIGGVEVADRLVRAALEAKKHVVTANKALLAERGAALFALAEANGCDLYFEAAVAGAIPADLGVPDHTPIENGNTAALKHRGQVAFQSAAVHLVTLRGQNAAGPEFIGLRQVPVPTTAKKEAQAELVQLGFLEVLAQAQRFRKVVSANFHGRFANLVRCRRGREAVAL